MCVLEARTSTRDPPAGDPDQRALFTQVLVHVL